MSAFQEIKVSYLRPSSTVRTFHQIYGPSLTLSERYGSLSDFAKGTTNRYFTTGGCRELVFPDVNRRIRQFSLLKTSIWINVAVYGEAYHYTASLVSGKKGGAVLQKFIRKVFKIPQLQVKTFTTPLKYLDDEFHPGGFGSNNVYLREGFELVFNCRNFGKFSAPLVSVKLTGIIGILKEPRILSKILSGEIKDSEALSSELLKLSFLRANKRDFSRVFFTHLETKTGTLKDSHKHSREYFKNIFNSYGEGWWHTLIASAFPLLLNSKHPYKKEMGEWTTFLEFTEDYLIENPAFLKQFVEFISGNGRIAQKILDVQRRDMSYTTKRFRSTTFPGALRRAIGDG